MLGRESRGGHRSQAKPWGPGGGTLQDARCTRGEGFELRVRVCASMRVCVRVWGCVHTGMRVGGVCDVCAVCTSSTVRGRAQDRTSKNLALGSSPGASQSLFLLQHSPAHFLFVD